MKWIKKIMEAKQLTFENQAEIKEWCNGKTWSLPPMRAVTGIKFEAAYGMDTASFGDWIIKDENGFWPCKPDIFEKTYESASLPSSSVSGEEDKEDFALLEEYDLKEKAAKIVNHVFDKVPEDNKRQFLINFINGLVCSAILHHNNRYVKKINVPDFKTTFK